MKIGFDLHGVLTESPEVLQPIIEFLATHNEIHIISGSERDRIIKELTELGYVEGIHYHKVFSMVDYLREVGTVMWQKWFEKEQRETWWCDPEDWWSCKGVYCLLEDIQVIFDNRIEYQEFIPESCRFYLIGGKQNGNENK